MEQNEYQWIWIEQYVTNRTRQVKGAKVSTEKPYIHSTVQINVGKVIIVICNLTLDILQPAESTHIHKNIRSGSGRWKRTGWHCAQWSCFRSVTMSDVAALPFVRVAALKKDTLPTKRNEVICKLQKRCRSMFIDIGLQCSDRANFVWLNNANKTDTSAANQYHIKPTSCEAVMISWHQNVQRKWAQMQIDNLDQKYSCETEITQIRK